MIYFKDRRLFDLIKYCQKVLLMFLSFLISHYVLSCSTIFKPNVVKRFFIFVIFLFIIISSSIGQEPYSYYSSAYHDKDYFIDVSYNKDKSYNLHIEVQSLDDKNYAVGIKINEKAISQVVSNLKEAKELYKILKSNAQKNNVSSLAQKMNVDAKVVVGYFKQRGKAYLDYSIKPKYSFVVERRRSRTEYLLRITTGRMISSVFEYIQCPSAEIVFSNEAEIDQFIEAISSPSF